MNIYPNAYYNYLAQRKAAYQQQKQRILQKIKDIYHAYNGVPGYRTMRVYLGREGMRISRPTVHRYMNRELGLLAVVRRRKPNYCKGHAHKVFPNLLQQNFTAEEINHKWCTDFTYLFLSNGSKRYRGGAVPEFVQYSTDKHKWTTISADNPEQTAICIYAAGKEIAEREHLENIIKLFRADEKK